MPGRPNSFEALAEQAAERIDQARAQGQQLSLLADQEPVAQDGAGRPVRGKGKAVSQVRDWLAAQGYRTPQEQLARMAGLASGDDPVTAAMVTAERVIAWAFADKTDKDGNLIKPGPQAYLHQFEVAYSVQLRAADAMLPFVAAKVSPDGPGAPVIMINVPGGNVQAPDPAVAARDVTPVPAGRMMPADAAWEIQQNQQVATGQSDQSDGVSRTERATD